MRYYFGSAVQRASDNHPHPGAGPVSVPPPVLLGSCLLPFQGQNSHLAAHHNLQRNITFDVLQLIQIYGDKTIIHNTTDLQILLEMNMNMRYIKSTIVHPLGIVIVTRTSKKFLTFYGLEGSSPCSKKALTPISNHLERITAVPRATTIRTMVMMGWLSIEMAHYCCTWVFRKPTCISHQLPVPVLLILGCGGLSRHWCSCWPARFDGCARWR